MTDRPAWRVPGEEGARLTPRGCAMVVAALEIAARQAGRAGVNYRGRDHWDDFAWLLETCRLGAQPPPSSGPGTGGTSWSLLLPDSGSTWGTREAASLLGVTQRAVVKAIGRGDLPATRAGHAWVLNEVDVRQYATGRRNGGRRVPRHVAGGPDRAAADVAGAAHPGRGDRAG